MGTGSCGTAQVPVPTTPQDITALSGYVLCNDLGKDQTSHRA